MCNESDGFVTLRILTTAKCDYVPKYNICKCLKLGTFMIVNSI